MVVGVGFENVVLAWCCGISCDFRVELGVWVDVGWIVWGWGLPGITSFMWVGIIQIFADWVWVWFCFGLL